MDTFNTVGISYLSLSNISYYSTPEGWEICKVSGVYYVLINKGYCRAENVFLNQYLLYFLLISLYSFPQSDLSIQYREAFLDLLSSYF